MNNLQEQDEKRLELIKDALLKQIVKLNNKLDF